MEAYKEDDFTWLRLCQVSAEGIQAARTAAGLSPQELAERVGVKLRQVQRWEKGSSKPSSESLEKLNGIFGVSWTK